MADLLETLRVKGLTLENRIVMPPMYTSLATPEGAVTPPLIRHYVERAEGVGLVIVEHSFIEPEGRLGERQLGVHDDSLIDGLERLLSSLHATGTPAVMQINHAGIKGGEKPVAPSADGEARELVIEEIEGLVEAFGGAAERAMRAGFDGVEVHGAHGFLLNQFFSPLSNRRRDRYGGSVGNRMRFPLEVVDRVKEKVGRRLLLYRLGSDDLNPKGVGIEDSKKFAARLEEAGVDVIDVSGGMCGSRPAAFQGKQGYFVTQAQQIGSVVDVPVIGVGGITDPEYANTLVLEGKVDLVAVGRAILEEAGWAAKAVERLRGLQPGSRRKA